MKTELDSVKWTHWFAEEVNYFEGTLEVTIVEGITSDTPGKLEVCGSTIENVYPVNVEPVSRKFKITFKQVLVYQVTDESYAGSDDTAIGSNGVLKCLEKSKFLKFVEKSTLVSKLAEGKYKHYCLMSSDDFFDVIATESPRIDQISFKGESKKTPNQLIKRTD